MERYIPTNGTGNTIRLNERRPMTRKEILALIAIFIFAVTAGGAGIWWVNQPPPFVDPYYVSPEEYAARLAEGQARNNAYLGTEQATLCPRDEGRQVASAACVDPIVISLLCDVSIYGTCQSIAQGIRASQQLYLLYPYLVDEQVVTRRADYTVVVSNPKGDIPDMLSHDVVVLKGHLAIDGNGYEQLEVLGRVKTIGARGNNIRMNPHVHISNIERHILSIINGHGGAIIGPVTF